MQDNGTAKRGNKLLRAALHYATQFGWAVFPLQPRQKVPLIPKRRGGSGWRDATTNPEQIAKWWLGCPDANIGIALGCVSGGIFVFDVDPRNGGERSHVIEHFGPIPDTVEALTGGGGCHVFLRGEVRGGVPLPGIEVKSDGSYVVAPPSIHPSGRVYQWEVSSRPDELPIASATPAIIRALELPRQRAGACTHSHPVDPASFVLGNAMVADGALGPQIRPGVFSALCPRRAQHTRGRDFDGSTVLFAPPFQGGRGRFHCSHAHCADLR